MNWDCIDLFVSDSASKLAESTALLERWDSYITSPDFYRVAQEPNRNRKPEPSEPFFLKPKAEPEPPEPFSRKAFLGASQMTTKFLTIKFAKFPKFIVMEFPKKNSVFGQFSVNFPPPQPPPKRKFYQYCRFGVSAFQPEFGAYRGLARVLKSPSSPQNCRNKQKILEKGAFIFCAQRPQPWYAPNPGAKEI